MISYLSGYKRKSRPAAAIAIAGDLPSQENPKSVVATLILANLSSRERVALYRFYIVGQDEDRISKDLRFEEGQFARLKSRLKGKLSSYEEAKPS
jgi:hypothetical protein